MCTLAQILLSTALLSTVALAQSNEETTAANNPFSLLDDAYQVKAFANLTASGASNIIDLTNAGTVGGLSLIHI